MNKSLSKISSSFQIQNPHTINSGTRNFREKLKSNILPGCNSNLEGGTTSLHRSKIPSIGGVNSRETNFKFSLTKNTSSGALRNSISYGSNTTNMASPVVNNVSLLKMEHSSKRKLDTSNFASM